MRCPSQVFPSDVAAESEAEAVPEATATPIYRSEMKKPRLKRTVREIRSVIRINEIRIGIGGPLLSVRCRLYFQPMRHFY